MKHHEQPDGQDRDPSSSSNRPKARRRRPVVEVELDPEAKHTSPAEPRGAAVCFTFPRADGDLANWMVMAAELFTANPDRFALSPELAAELDQHARTFFRAFMAASAPGRRTTDAIGAKNQARDGALEAFRAAMMHIRQDASIDPIAKVELGCTPAKPRTGRRPIEPPDTAPFLMIVEVGDGQHTLRIADSATLTKRAKPAGAASMQLLIMLDDRLHTQPDEMAGVVRRATRSRFTVDFKSFDPPPAAGLTATYFGRWMTATSKPGPWSAPVAMTVAYAIPMPGAGAEP